MQKKYEVDLVVLWVDGADPKWQEQKRQYAPAALPFNEKAFRDWGLLRYWFRGVEENIPWIHRIYFITWGHLPEWLDVCHPKLRIVRHEDYIPKRYLPTFSNIPIELNVHRIEELSERFIFMNDDMFFLGKVEEEYYFQNGLPCDFLALQPITEVCNTGFGNLLWNDIACINRNFDFHSCAEQHKDKWFHKNYTDNINRGNSVALGWKCFPGFMPSHFPNATLKSTLGEIWNKEYHLLQNTCLHKFRSSENITVCMVRDWQLASGNFVPRMPEGCVFVGTGENPDRIRDAILSVNNKIICVNEDTNEIDFESRADYIRELFQLVLPEMSSFEKF